MAAQTPRKPAGRSGTKKTAAKKRAPSKSRSAAQSKRGRPTAKPKTAAKTKKAPARRKKAASAFQSKYKPYLLGLTLGLVIGCLGALAAVYIPRSARPPAQPSVEAPGPKAASPAQREPARAEAANSDAKPVYEEEHRLEVQIKTIDQTVYRALRSLGLEPGGIRYTEAGTRTSGGRHWNHASIQARLPEGLTPENALARVTRSLAAADIEPRPDVRPESLPGALVAHIRWDGLETHRLTLAPSSEPEPIRPPDRTPAAVRPRIALIIDDLGLNPAEARCFMDLDLPLTLSVLPFLDHSRDVAEEAHRRGKTVMLHLPMQPSQWPQVDSGPGSLLVSMDQKQIQGRVKAAIKAVPHVCGVNNHMGSRFTADDRRMTWTLETVGQNRLFFVDSVTSGRSQGQAVAQKLGLPFARRTVFLDNIQDPEAIFLQLQKLIAHGRRHGSAIGIGHAHPVTCQTLKSKYNYLTSKAKVVPITELIQHREEIQYVGKQ